MNRRWFLKSTLGAAAGVAISGELIEALAPRPKIFLPPRMRVEPQWILDHSDLAMGDVITFDAVLARTFHSRVLKQFVVLDSGRLTPYGALT
jgi:hypothetical protein